VAREDLHRALVSVLREMGVADPDPRLERPREPTHGDWATNVALTLAARLRRPPRQIAEEVAGRIDLEGTGAVSVEVAGPGFLNFRLATASVAEGLERILATAEAFGRSSTGDGTPIMVEWVSANPTGPLHLGHGRQAALGDAIASLLEWTGWSVHREFYYNDAGNQMDLLAGSVRARYLELLGEPATIPEGGYHGAASRPGPSWRRSTGTWPSSACTSTGTTGSPRSTRKVWWTTP
jgi:arginyl-tRNA synthetase